MKRRIETGTPDLTGRTAIVTGATSGIGLETALAFARMGARVVLSGRRERLGRAAVERIAVDFPSATASFEPLDLADLSSVAVFAARVGAAHPAIDILVNNAGVLAVPRRTLTADGFELQFGTNFLGHFALTARLLPNLVRAEAPRVVGLGSLSHHAGRIELDDLQAGHGYRPWKAYAQSKLAVLMFALELQRRSDRLNWGLMSLAAHPGLAVTELPDSGPTLGRAGKPLSQRLMSLALRLAGQSAAAGAAPTVAAATAPDLRGGTYLGPAGLVELRGPPARAWRAGRAKHTETAAALWSRAEALTGVRYPDRPMPKGGSLV